MVEHTYGRHDEWLRSVVAQLVLVAAVVFFVVLAAVLL